VRSSIASALLFVVVIATLGSGWGKAAKPLRPGGKIGAMRLVRGVTYEADQKIFEFCDPVILKPGRYARSCLVPRARRLFIGYGNFEPTLKALNRDFMGQWSLWVDGHPVNLRAFGTSDRTLVAFPAAGGKDVILREWKVILVGATPGKHTLRYRSRIASFGTTDATWTFVVARR
jgi:hypothetical protein